MFLSFSSSGTSKTYLLCLLAHVCGSPQRHQTHLFLSQSFIKFLAASRLDQGEEKAWCVATALFVLHWKVVHHECGRGTSQCSSRCLSCLSALVFLCCVVGKRFPVEELTHGFIAPHPACPCCFWSCFNQTASRDAPEEHWVEAFLLLPSSILGQKFLPLPLNPDGFLCLLSLE